jgi:hypothetical protein
MSRRALRDNPGDLEGDRVRLVAANPDRQVPVGPFLEDDAVLAGRVVNPDAIDRDLDQTFDLRTLLALRKTGPKSEGPRLSRLVCFVDLRKGSISVGVVEMSSIVLAWSQRQRGPGTGRTRTATSSVVAASYPSAVSWERRT